MNDNNYSYFIMSIVANMCQLMSFQMDVAQSSNNDLMKELQKIEDQNKEIIELLKNK